MGSEIFKRDNLFRLIMVIELSGVHEVQLLHFITSILKSQNLVITNIIDQVAGLLKSQNKKAFTSHFAFETEVMRYRTKMVRFKTEMM